jgi:hypothetical protein
MSQRRQRVADKCAVYHVAPSKPGRGPEGNSSSSFFVITARNTGSIPVACLIVAWYKRTASGN